MNEINFGITDIEEISLSMDVGVKKIYPAIENLEVTPKKEKQEFNHTDSYGYDKVVVNSIPNEYIIPSGTLPITENKTYDVTEYSKVSASVYPAPNLQDKSITITENGTQNITYDEGYDGLNSVEITTNVENGGNNSPNESILPDGYIQLEYIASDGSQIIDTGFQPTEKTEFEITFSTQNELVYSGDFGSIFGARYTYNAGGYQLATFAPSDGGSHNNGAFMFGNVFHSAYLKNDGSVQTVTFKNGLYTGGNGGTKDLSSITSVNTMGNLYLFACYETKANKTVDPGKMTLYSCRFEENGEAIRNFIPARRTSDSALGLYDTVTARFFMTDRGNSFKAGPEKVITDSSPTNIFVQETEPENRYGLWVKTSKYDNKDICFINDKKVSLSSSGWEAQNKYANLPHQNSYAHATGYKGFMYFCGGYSSQAYNLYKYDMNSNKYTQLPNIPYSFGWGGFCAYNDELYFFGGQSAPQTAYKYNLASQAYTKLANIPVGFVSAVAVAVMDKIYLITGRPSSSSSTRYDTIYEYDPQNNTYRLCNARIHKGDCKSAIGFDKYIYIFGSDINYRTCYRFDVINDVAEKMRDMPFYCTDAYSCATKSAIYLVGSSRSAFALWKYEPAIEKYTKLPDVPYSTWGPSSGALINDEYLFAIGDTQYHNKVQVYKIAQKTYLETPTNGILIDEYDRSRGTKIVGEISLFNSNIEYYADGVKQDVEIYLGDGLDWYKI